MILQTKNIINQQFGRLLTIENVGKNKYGIRLWRCKCDCGQYKTASEALLKNGQCKSCGCLQRDFTRRNRHPHSITSIDNLNNIEFQTLIGSILGDGCIQKSKTNYQYRNASYEERHTYEQTDYVNWKGMILNKLKPTLSTNKLKERRLVLATCEMFNDLYPMFYQYPVDYLYKKYKNTILPTLINKLDHLGLLVWFLDDGNNNYNSLSICGGSFSKEQLQPTINIINSNLSINTYLTKAKNNPYLIYIPSQSRDKLIPIWNRLFDELKIPDCMRYKLPKVLN
jgi:hypothetical protein